MRDFDPRLVGGLECRTWVTYYRREWLPFLLAAIRLVRHTFGLNWPATLYGAWLVLRANQLWALPRQRSRGVPALHAEVLRAVAPSPPRAVRRGRGGAAGGRVVARASSPPARGARQRGRPAGRGAGRALRARVPGGARSGAARGTGARARDGPERPLGRRRLRPAQPAGGGGEGGACPLVCRPAGGGAPLRAGHRSEWASSGGRRLNRPNVWGVVRKV